MLNWRRGALTAVILVVAGVVWYGRSEKQKVADDNAILTDALNIVSQVEGYTAKRERVDEVVRAAHKEAFKLAYAKGTPPTRLQPENQATFSQNKYLELLFMYMRGNLGRSEQSGSADQAAADHKLSIALENLRRKLGVRSPTGL